MTHIANPYVYKTKKAFREAVNENPAVVRLDDPSFFDPVSGYVTDILKAKGEFTVTNHPKRSWFARVYRGKDGKVKVD